MKMLQIKNGGLEGGDQETLAHKDARQHYGNGGEHTKETLQVH